MRREGASFFKRIVSQVKWKQVHTAKVSSILLFPFFIRLLSTFTSFFGSRAEAAAVDSTLLRSSWLVKKVDEKEKHENYEESFLFYRNFRSNESTCMYNIICARLPPPLTTLFMFHVCSLLSCLLLPVYVLVQHLTDFPSLPLLVLRSFRLAFCFLPFSRFIYRCSWFFLSFFSFWPAWKIKWYDRYVCTYTYLKTKQATTTSQPKSKRTICCRASKIILFCVLLQKVGSYT